MRFMERKPPELSEIHIWVNMYGVELHRAKGTSFQACKKKARFAKQRQGFLLSQQVVVLLHCSMAIKNGSRDESSSHYLAHLRIQTQLFLFSHCEKPQPRTQQESFSSPRLHRQCQA